MNSREFAQAHTSFLKIQDNEQFREFLCVECGEWTDTDEPCCGIVTSEYDSEPELNDER